MSVGDTVEIVETAGKVAHIIEGDCLLTGKVVFGQSDMEKCLVDVVCEHQIHAFRYKAGLCEAVQVSPGLAEVEGPAYGAVAEAREPHSAAGASDTEMSADVEEACLCVGSAVGGEYHFPGCMEQGFELSFQLFHRHRHTELVGHEGIFSICQFAQRSLAYETGRDVGDGDGI